MSSEGYSKERDSDCREADWPAGLYRRGSSFRYRRNAGGRRLVEVWGEMPLADAVRKAVRYNLDLGDGRMPLLENGRRETTVADFALDTWLRKKAAELAPGSLARYRSVVENFVDYLERVRGLRSPLLRDVTYEVAADYVAHRASAPLMPNGGKKFTRAIRHGASKKTVHNERVILFQVFKEAAKRGLVNGNPFAEVRPKKPTVHEVAAVHHPLTAAEEDALLRAAAEVDLAATEKGNPRLRDVLLFLLRTGLREDEMRHLEWGDIDWREGLIHVRQKQVTETRVVPVPRNAVAGLRKKTAGRSPEAPVFRDERDLESFGAALAIRSRPDLLAIKACEVDLAKMTISTTRTYPWKPKGTNGVVPMCAAVRELLAGLFEKRTGNFVFAHKDGGRCRVDLLDLLKKAQKLAGIGGRLRVHDLRHTLAVRLRRDKGVPLETIMGILRHADIKETLIYAPYSLAEGRAAIGRLDGGAESPLTASPASAPGVCFANEI